MSDILTVISIVVNTILTAVLVINLRKDLKSEPTTIVDPYEKYRNQDGLLMGRKPNGK